MVFKTVTNGNKGAKMGECKIEFQHINIKMVVDSFISICKKSKNRGVSIIFCNKLTTDAPTYFW